MAALAVEVLEEWREAERALTLLPAESAERDAVAAGIHEMRALYQQLTDRTIPETRALVVQARERIEATRAILQATKSTG